MTTWLQASLGGSGWECEIRDERVEKSLVVRVQEFVMEDFEDQ